MPDVHDKQTRSYNMSHIKSKDTKPEMMVRKFLFSQGFRYKLHDKKLPGTPDIVFTKLRTVIFVHGCYWHGHENCKYFVLPKTRTDWWLKKINRNKQLDSESLVKLNKMGWKVFTIFECELKKLKREKTLSGIVKKLNLIKNKINNATELY
jgi:DNA mismatch endonuclease (patch repair protein)